ncbi:Capsule polysaccharide biosynthesis, spore coat polysaccharide biosynthesis protein spsB [Candidatus Magnetobacterium bavaricum]|uniref:Capsule polysaccharide biosynthesis, spore coat polysaccharide biosynthesis protein spsB n=1 Tax=Candidatus Magnetobacterium bavaricum TaxID=29290 RepID=A0A0F3GJJ4_9BACT|nr:Capsule polysaccharide biosynthesis, spore coat polysaccharide biosynthesis protein spsB [Candidatus Magnetobacterium bavaricum]
MKQKIFTVTYGGGHVNIIIPLLKELKNREDLELSTLGLSIAAESLKKAGIEHHTISHYKELIMDEIAWKYGNSLAMKNHTEGKGISLEETVIYFGASMRDLIREKGQEEALKIYADCGRACFIPLYTMQLILEQESPDMLMTGNCPRMERAAMMVAKERGIKVLSLNDLLGFDKKYLFPADKIAVISEITRENLVKQGNPPGNIIITGSPAFDLILEEIRTFNKHYILDEIGLKTDSKVFLLATQPDKNCTWEMINMMVTILDNYPEHYLVIKPHPGEDNRLYADYLSKLSHPRVVLTDIPVRKIIYVSELTVTIYSTVGIESILMGVPLIQLNLMGIKNPIPLYEYGVSIEVKDYTELEKSVDKVLNDEKHKTEVEESRNHYFKYLLSGLGVKNCINLINQLLNSRSF